MKGLMKQAGRSEEALRQASTLGKGGALLGAIEGGLTSGGHGRLMNIGVGALGRGLQHGLHGAIGGALQGDDDAHNDAQRSAISGVSGGLLHPGGNFHGRPDSRLAGALRGTGAAVLGEAMS